MGQCFVIQPFDKGKYDKRYKDIFEPAISKAGYDAYRVDNDLSVRVPIEDIEYQISQSDICFAEISTDNPNVWYELGFAFACQKDVIMVCSDERVSGFPFDIQHRHVTKYSTSSISDFKDLEESIIKKILAYKKNKKTVEFISNTSIADREGLKSHEIALLVIIMENQLTSEDSMSVYQLKSAMNNAGYTDIATSISIRTLAQKKYIESFIEIDEYNNGQEYTAIRIIEGGESWIINNQEKLEFKLSNPSSNIPF